MGRGFSEGAFPSVLLATDSREDELAEEMERAGELAPGGTSFFLGDAAAACCGLGELSLSALCLLRSDLSEPMRRTNGSGFSGERSGLEKGGVDRTSKYILICSLDELVLMRMNCSLSPHNSPYEENYDRSKGWTSMIKYRLPCKARLSRILCPTT